MIQVLGTTNQVTLLNIFHILLYLLLNFSQSTSDTKENDDDGWIEVNSRKEKMIDYSQPVFINNHPTRLTGKRNYKIGIFKSVEKMVDIFLGNMDKLATADDIKKYIVDNLNVPIVEVRCLKLF